MATAENVNNTVFTSLMILMAILAMRAISDSEWADLFVIGQAITICSMPYILKKYFSIYTPIMLRIGFVIFMFATLVLGEIADLYNAFWWWDIVLHLVSSGGVTIIGFIIMTLIYRDRDLRASPLLTSFLAFSFAISVAVIWEAYEFIIDLFFETDTPMQLSNTDTMTDLLVAMVGSLAICFYGYTYIKRQTARTIVEATIEEGKINNL